MEFRILGPLEVTAGEHRLELRGPRQQAVLAALLLNAGSVVTASRLQQAAYGEDPPPTSRAQVQMAISELRRRLSALGHSEAIATRPQGYVLQVGEGWLDSLRFAELVAVAHAAAEAGRRDEAVASYRDAERLWRGHALEGIESPAIEAAAVRLDEQRISARERRITLELQLGRHHEAVGELTELVRVYPLREELRGLLMLSLHRSGRQAEALEEFRRARQQMIDDLGIEPSEQLRQLQQAILAEDPSLQAQIIQASAELASPAVPRLLPSDVADFTGRAEQVKQLCGLMTRPAAREGGAVPVAVIAGEGGAGKTTIAVHAAHMLTGQFPDGLLFADLHAAARHPVPPEQVLERFLRALGVPGPQLPASLDERAETYRNLLAGRQTLVVLDDAGEESQVVPLLPGTGPAAVMVTSRSRLAGLPGAQHIAVGMLDSGKAIQLLGLIAGTQRVQREPQAAAAVAAHCGHLPLALRIAGARLSARPHWSIEQLAGRLADETRRLDELRYGDLHVRASISLSYEGVSADARRLLRLLGILEVSAFSSWVAAPLLDMPYDQASDLLDDLVSAHLVEAGGSGPDGSGQYRCHDLIRAFARERLAAEDSAASRQAALERVLGALLYLLELVRGGSALGGDVRLEDAPARWPLPDVVLADAQADPMTWFDRQRPMLVAGIHQAASAGFAHMCWSLVVAGDYFLDRRGYYDDLKNIIETALQASRAASDLRGQATMLYHRGSDSFAHQRHSSASQDLAAALRLFRQVGDNHSAGLVLRIIGSVARVGGRLDEAAQAYEQALVEARASADDVEAAFVLHSLAQLSLDRGDAASARSLLAEALRTCEGGSDRLISQVLHRMGEADLLADEPDRAVARFEQALAVVRGVDVVGEAYVLQGLGVARLRHGDLALARDALQRAAQLADRVSEQLIGGRAVLGFAELALADGDAQEAVTLGSQASDAFARIAAPRFEADAYELLSQAHAALDDASAAQAAAAKARALRAAWAGRDDTASHTRHSSTENWRH